MKKLFSFVCALVCAMSLSAAVTYSVQVPAGTNTCYIAGKCTNWSHKEMTKVDDTHYTITLETTEQNGYKYCSGPGWEFVEKDANKNDVSDRTYAANDVVAQWAKVYNPGAAVSYVDITIRVKADAAPNIWWWGAGDKCPNAVDTKDAEGNAYDWNTNHPVMTAVADKAGWYEWVFKDVNASLGVTFKLNKGDNAIKATESTCYNVEGTVIDCGSTGGEGGGTDPDPVTNDTVFFVNTYGWEIVKCYAWTDGKCENATYPGIKLTEKCNYQLQGADVYFYVAEQGKYAKCLFNCGSDECKSVDLTWDAGKYFCKGAWKTRAELESDEPIEDVITYGIGSNKNGYNSDNDPMTVSDDKTTATCTIELTKDEKFEFSVVETTNGTSATWLKNTTTTITRENNSATLATNDDKKNTPMTVDVTGTYTFVFTIGNSTITVTYPSSTPTALSNTEAENSTVKVIRNGQVLIVREGVTYNMMGQVIQ